MSFATEDLVYGVVEGAIVAMFAAAGHDVATPFPRICVRRGDAEVRLGQAGPPARAWRSRTCCRSFADGLPRLCATRFAEPDGAVRGFVVTGRRQLLAQASRRPGRRPATQLGGAASRGPGSCRRGRHQSSALKVVRRRAAASRPFDAGRWLARRPAAVHGRDQRRRSRDVLGRLRLQVAKRAGLLQAGRLQVSSGSRDSRCSSGTRDEKRWNSMHHPFTSPRPRGRAVARVGARSRARARLRPRAERLRNRRRQHQDSSRRRAAARVPAARHLGRGRARRDSASSSTRSSTARRRMAASRSASIASSRSCAAKRRSARSSRFRKRRRPWI